VALAALAHLRALLLAALACDVGNVCVRAAEEVWRTTTSLQRTLAKSAAWT
jgi:hypothetical protein